MTADECTHRLDGLPVLTSVIRTIYLSDTGRTVAEVDIRCQRCGEPYRFLGAPIGLAVTGPTTNVDGTELRIPIEPASWRALEQAKPSASERFILNPATHIAHDRWFLGETCNTDDIENAMVKAAIPQAYKLCEHCRRNEQERRPVLDYALALTAAAVEDALALTAAAVEDFVEAAVAAQEASAPVVPLEAGDAEPGQPQPAQAAIMLPADPGDDDGPDADAPTGTVISRPRPQGRNRR